MARKKKTGDTLAFNNAAKTLLANIRFASVDTPIKSITVTSSIPNEGKSTIAFNLAQAIATSGKSVLLVECDMRHRTLANMLGIPLLLGRECALSRVGFVGTRAVAMPTRLQVRDRPPRPHRRVHRSK